MNIIIFSCCVPYLYYRTHAQGEPHAAHNLSLAEVGRTSQCGAQCRAGTVIAVSAGVMIAVSAGRYNDCYI